MAALKTLVGWLALLFHLCFALVILGFALASSPHPPPGMVPVMDWLLACVLLGSGLFCRRIVLAALGRGCVSCFVLTGAVAILLFEDAGFSGYRFAGRVARAGSPGI